MGHLIRPILWEMKAIKKIGYFLLIDGVNISRKARRIDKSIGKENKEKTIYEIYYFWSRQ